MCGIEIDCNFWFIIALVLCELDLKPTGSLMLSPAFDWSFIVNDQPVPIGGIKDVFNMIYLYQSFVTSKLHGAVLIVFVRNLEAEL